jgi:hypothetical protein
VVKSLAWPRAPKVLTTAIYIGLGWVLVPYASDVLNTVHATGVALLLFGGIAYRSVPGALGSHLFVFPSLSAVPSTADARYIHQLCRGARFSQPSLALVGREARSRRGSRARQPCLGQKAAAFIAETNRIRFVLLAVQNRTFGPHLAAINGILIPVVVCRLRFP